MTNEEKLVLEKLITRAQDDIQDNIRYAKYCANAFLDRIEKAQGNLGSTLKEIDELVRELENIAKAIEYCDVRTMAIGEIQDKLEK